MIRPCGAVLISEKPIAKGTYEQLNGVLPDSVPHLDAAARAELYDAYLGNLTWPVAFAAVGLSFESLPETTRDLSPKQ